LHDRTKFRKDRSSHCGDIAIFVIFKMVVANFVTVVRLNMVNVRQRARLRQHWSNVDITAI